MKKLFAFLLLIVWAASSQTSNAQSTGSLTGFVKDDKGEVLSYGSVALLRASDTSVVTGAAVDLEGKFNLKTPANGTYLLRISAMGFANTNTAPFQVTSPSFSKDFGGLVLKQDAQNLKEVKVEALRPTIVHQPDKMVVSVEGTALASGRTAWDMLQKSPGVWVDQDGNIQLNGKSGVKVMIDGKVTYLNGKELQTMLQTMPAENMKDMELITNPSAKYDAEGTGGIININLKKNTLGGLNGSVYTGYSFNKEHGFTTGFNLNYKKDKWNTTASVDMARRVNLRKADMNRTFHNGEEVSSFDQKGLEKGVRYSPSLRFSTDYDISPKHSVGVNVKMSRSTTDNFFNTDSYLRSTNPADNKYVEARNDDDNKFTSSNFNAHYVAKLDTLGASFSADLDYIRITDNSTGGFYNAYFPLNRVGIDSLDLLSSANPTHYNIYSGKIDFTKPLGDKKSKLEMGAKASHVVSDNALNFYFGQDADRTLDPNRTNHFIYTENIYAAYVNFSTTFGPKWSVQAGLRAEQTDSKGNSLTADLITKRDYLDFFPSLFLQQKVTDNYQVGYKYSRRINRPYYGNLNPFIFYLDPYTWAQGNPYLRPEYTHSFEVTQTLKGNYNLSLGYSTTKDMIDEVPQQNVEDLTTVFQQRNISRNENWDATLVAPIKVNSKWDISNNVTLAYQKNKTMLQDLEVENNQVFFMAQVNNNVLLPKSFKLEVNGSYRGKAAWGLYQAQPAWGVDAGIKRSFLEDKLDVSLNVTDIFRTMKMNGTANIANNTNTFNQYRYSQSVRVNLRYRFNKGEKFEVKRRNNSLDELNRAGGN